MKKLFFAAILVILVVSCAEPSEGNTITVEIADKAITYAGMIEPDTDSGEYDITHYRFEAYRSGNLLELAGTELPSENLVAQSSYLKRGSKFTLTHVLTGSYWKVHAIAYIDPDGGVAGNELIQVADGWSEPVFIGSGHNIIHISIDELDETKMPSVAFITLHLPIGINKYSNDVGYNYSVYKSADISAGIYNEAYAGTGKLSINDSDPEDLTSILKISGLHQGKHLIVLSIHALDSNGEALIGPEGEYLLEQSDAEAIILIPSIDSKGDMYFNQSIEVNPGIEIDDSISGRIGLNFLEASYSDAEGLSISVEALQSIDDDIDTLVFLDGKPIDGNGQWNRNKYCIYPSESITAGTHRVLLVVLGNKPNSFGACSGSFYIETDGISFEDNSGKRGSK